MMDLLGKLVNKPIAALLGDGGIQRTEVPFLGQDLQHRYLITGFLLSSTIVLANFTSNIFLLILIMSIAFFAKGLAGLTWSLVGDMAPKELIGLTGGIFNTIGNIAGIVTPLVIGFILAKTNSFSGALIFVASVLFVGALSYIFIVNKPERIVLIDKN